MKAFKTGLAVGKFAPLHRGHQLVIDTALSQCDHVVLISWSIPEYPGCEPLVRAAWLAVLYPQTTRLVIDQAWLDAWSEEQAQPALPSTAEPTSSSGATARSADRRARSQAPALPNNDDPDVVHRQFVGWLCTHVLGCVVDAVFTSDDYGPGFAYELGQWFHDRGVVDHTVTHVSVDPVRKIIPTSGTMIRESLTSSNEWLSPVVAASFVKRVTILGGESSGKSTLAAALADHFATEWVPEYGRELWDIREGALSYEDLLLIATEQVHREEQAARTPRAIETGILICDTSPLTTLLYCLDMFEKAEPELYTFATRTYDLVVLCSPDFAFVQDGTRRDDTFRTTQHAWYQHELATRSIPHVIVSGSVQDRVNAVANSLSPKKGTISNSQKAYQ
jgi:HTH-type transcriptional regulator, transcriptional repressor of NAD biosynthesis genes